MVTKEMIKSKIDRVQNEYLELLYKIIKAFTVSEPKASRLVKNRIKEGSTDWQIFIDTTYGSLAENPIERAEQGSYEERGNIQ
ncbi:MAG TPA: DUF758 domain-containing protein [bacterium]|nr:DUF758 domain-containing protein [bacterium]HPN45625.1 DUF758 domain-containing protein [bacterium]